MKRYRMHKLQQLQAAEEDVKARVRQQLITPRKTRKPVLLTIAVTAIILLFIGTVIQLKPAQQANGTAFQFTPVAVQPLPVRQSVFLVTEFETSRAITLATIELATPNGPLMSFGDEHIALRAWQVSGAEVGYYEQWTDVASFEPILLEEPIELAANTTEQLMLEVIVNEAYTPRDDIQLAIRYHDGEYMLNELVDWPVLAQLMPDSMNAAMLYESLPLSLQELTAYERFKEAFDKNQLASLSPKSIAKLYALSLLEGDMSLTYQFYTTHKDWVQWSLQEFLQSSPFDRMSPSEAQQLLVDLENGQFIETADGGYIAFFSATSEYEQGFQLILSEAGIWEVSYMPLQ